MSVEFLVERINWVTDHLGDFWKVEDVCGLLEEPHPSDPNRLAAFPLGGYGWPTEEGVIRLRLDALAARGPVRPDRAWKLNPGRAVWKDVPMQPPPREAYRFARNHYIALRLWHDKHRQVEELVALRGGAT